MEIDIMWAFLTFAIGIFVGALYMENVMEQSIKEKNHE